MRMPEDSHAPTPIIYCLSSLLIDRYCVLLLIILVPPLFIEGNSHSYNRTIFVFARATVPY